MVLDPDTKEYVGKILKDLENEVTIHFVKGETPECVYCSVIEELLQDISSVAPKVKYQVHELGDEFTGAHGIKNAPYLFFEGKPGMVYMGTPSGHEFQAFLEDIIDVGKGSTEIPAAAAKMLAKVNDPIEILVFVTPSCPYCPLAVRTAHRFAFVKPNIKGIMVEALEYQQLSDRYNVSAVPKIVIRREGEDLLEWEGAVPDEAFAHYILHAVGEEHE